MGNNVRLGGNFSNGTFGDQIHYFALDPVYHFAPAKAFFRPYLTVGAGPIWFRPTNQAIHNNPGLGTSTEFAFNYGGGVKVRMSPLLGLRFDVRGILSRNPSFDLPTTIASSGGLLSGVQATLGLIFYFGTPPAHPPKPLATEPKPKPTLQPLNPGEMTGGDSEVCQGRPITLHATATDPAGHALAYEWKANGAVVGGNNPDLSYTPGSAGDFQFEVEVSDAADPTRVMRIGPRTLAIREYMPPRIESIVASPNSLTLNDAAAQHTVRLAANVGAGQCSGNLTYKWSVSEGSLSNDAGPNAVFDASSLNFDSGLGQTKTITATLAATDETGKTITQSRSFTIDYPAQYKRLADVVFAKNSARVNNCGKRILIEQAAPQAGSAFDIVLVGHRAADEDEMFRAGHRGLDEQRVLEAAAVLTGDGGTCANLDPSQVRIASVGTMQLSTPDPALCGTSNIPHTKERTGGWISDADKERRVEVYLVPKDSAVLPPSAKNTKVPATAILKALGCPK